MSGWHSSVDSALSYSACHDLWKFAPAVYSIEPKEDTMNPTVDVSDLPSVDQLRMAERELSAFFTAVEILFGSKQAKLSTEDWLNATEQLLGRNEPTQR